jgi:hypothetical protein
VSGHLGERLSALLDGELSADDRAAAQVHLRECPACAQQLEELAAVDAMARDVPVEAPAGYFDELPGRVRTRLRERRKPRLAPAAVWAAAAAAVVMVAVVTPRLLREARSPAPAATPVVAPAGAPATIQGRAATADAGAASPAATAAGAAPPAAALTRTKARAESDKAPATTTDTAASKERLAKAVTVATAAPPPPAQEAEMQLSRDEARLGAAADRRMAGAAPEPPPAAPAPAPANTPGYAAAPAAPQAAGAPSARGAVASMQEQKAEDAPARDSAGAARPTAETRKESYQGRRLRGDERYEVLVARRPATAAEARDAARLWEAFARDLPGDRHADEARVRAVESLATAWRLGGAAEDLTRARGAARSYLEGGQARQPERVRAVLEGLPPSP